MKTNTQDNATPRPWIDDGQSNDDLIINSKWGEICRVRYSNDYAQRDANARLICQAVNEYAALCAIAKVLENTIRIHGEENPAGKCICQTCHSGRHALQSLSALRNS